MTSQAPAKTPAVAKILRDRAAQQRAERKAKTK